VKYSKRVPQIPEPSAIEIAQTLSGSKEADTDIDGIFIFNNYHNF